MNTFIPYHCRGCFTSHVTTFQWTPLTEDGCSVAACAIGFKYAPPVRHPRPRLLQILLQQRDLEHGTELRLKPCRVSVWSFPGSAFRKGYAGGRRRERFARFMIMFWYRVSKAKAARKTHSASDSNVCLPTVLTLRLRSNWLVSSHERQPTGTKL